MTHVSDPYNPSRTPCGISLTYSRVTALRERGEFVTLGVRPTCEGCAAVLCSTCWSQRVCSTGRSLSARCGDCLDAFRAKRETNRRQKAQAFAQRIKEKGTQTQ